VHWVEPKLVAEITYLTWTADNLLRHTVYVGLREDKPATEVRREIAGVISIALHWRYRNFAFGRTPDLQRLWRKGRSRHHSGQSIASEPVGQIIQLFVFGSSRAAEEASGSRLTFESQ
jgi:hypothetical protein